MILVKKALPPTKFNNGKPNHILIDVEPVLAADTTETSQLRVVVTLDLVSAPTKPEVSFIVDKKSPMQFLIPRLIRATHNQNHIYITIFFADRLISFAFWRTSNTPNNGHHTLTDRGNHIPLIPPYTTNTELLEHDGAEYVISKNMFVIPASLVEVPKHMYGIGECMLEWTALKE